MKNLSKGFPHIEKLFVEKVKIIVSWILNEAAWKIQIDAQTYDFKTLFFQYLALFWIRWLLFEIALTITKSRTFITYERSNCPSSINHLFINYLFIYLSTHVRGEPVLTRVGSECCCGVTCRDADSSLPDLKRKLCISGHFRSFPVISGHFRPFQVISGHFKSCFD